MGRRKYQIKDTMDTGTPEMARRFTVIPKLSSPTTLAMKIMDGTEMDRMLFNDAITPMEHGTLTTLAKRLHDYGYDDLRSPSYEGFGSVDPSIAADKKSDKIRGAVALLKRMDEHPAIGRYRRKKVINLALYSAPWGGKRNQIEDLKHVIAALDDIFIRRS